MFKLKLLVIALVIMMAFLPLGCDNQDIDVSLDNTLSINNMDFVLADASNIEVHEFQLGEGDLRNLIGRPVPAPLDGIIAVPNMEGPHPLVVIFHGNTPVQSVRERMYSGFDYLVRQLAAEGYVVISFNVLVNYSFEMGEPAVHNEWALALFDYHLDFLEQANAGQDVGHGVDLANMIDLNQIHLIGHSRGGEVTEDLARRDEELGLGRIRSMIRIGTTVIPQDGHYPDIPTGIILPEFDGDVPQDGQLIFDEIMMEGLNQSIVSLVYLRGANHNFFNRMFTVDDRTGGGGSVAQMYPETWLTREQQEDFIMHYAAAFLAMVDGKREPWGTFSVMEPQPVTMFGYEVVASTYISGRQRILPVPSEEVINRATGMITCAVHFESSEEADYDITLRPLVTPTIGGTAGLSFYVQTAPLESSGPFNHPAVFGREDMRLPLYALQWASIDCMLFFLPLIDDFSNYNALSLYVAVDSYNELNPQGRNQAFTVALTDSSGIQQSVIIPVGSSALAYHPGYAFQFELWDNVLTGWTGYMPLGELRIPLTYFDEVDLSSIAEISIIFDQTPSGAVMLSNIYLK